MTDLAPLESNELFVYGGLVGQCTRRRKLRILAQEWGKQRLEHLQLTSPTKVMMHGREISDSGRLSPGLDWNGESLRKCRNISICFISRARLGYARFVYVTFN